MKMLPARAPPIRGESLYSLVRRMAGAMGYETTHRILSQLPDDRRVPSWLNELKDERLLGELANLFGVSVHLLGQSTIHRFAAALVVKLNSGDHNLSCDRKTRLRYFTPKSRVCPQCLEEDSAELLIWSFRPLPVCVRHGVLLDSKCRKCGRQWSNGRLSDSACQCGEVVTTESARRIPDDVVQMLLSIQNSLEQNTPLISRASVPAGFYWLERMADAAKRAENWSQRVSSELGLQTELERDFRAWIVAAYTVSDWPNRFRLFLDSYVRQPKSRHTSTGVSRRFGSLLREAHKLELQGDPVFADVLRDYLTKQYSAGLVTRKICLFRSDDREAPLRQGNHVSQTVAARTIRTTVPTIRRLIGDGILTGEVHPAGANGRSVGVVSKDSVDELQRQLCASNDCTEAAEQLGISRHRVLDLIHAGLLPRSVKIDHAWKIPRASIRSLLDVVDSLAYAEADNTGWVSIREATRQHGKSGLNLANAVRLLVERNIRGRRSRGGTGFQGVLLHAGDLETRLPAIRTRRHQEHGYPLQQAARILFPGRLTKETVLKKLMELNLLYAERIDRQWHISADEIKRFRSAYCLATEAATIVGRHRQTLSRWEAEGLLTPVYGKRVTPDAGFTIYLRADIERLTVSDDSSLPDQLNQKGN